MRPFPASGRTRRFDAKRIIRFKDVRGAELDRAIEILLAETEDEGRKRRYREPLRGSRAVFSRYPEPVQATAGTWFTA